MQGRHQEHIHRYTLQKPMHLLQKWIIGAKVLAGNKQRQGFAPTIHGGKQHSTQGGFAVNPNPFFLLDRQST